MKITPPPSGFRPRRPRTVADAEELHMQSKNYSRPDSVTNAGAPPAAWDSKLPHPTADVCSQWAYRVNRQSDDPERAMLCWGTREVKEGDTPETIAHLVAGQQREAFPTYNGILWVAVWSLRPEDHYRRPVPQDASWHEFAPGTPDVPDPESCQHGQLDYCANCDGEW